MGAEPSHFVSRYEEMGQLKREDGGDEEMVECKECCGWCWFAEAETPFVSEEAGEGILACKLCLRLRDIGTELKLRIEELEAMLKEETKGCQASKEKG